MADKPTHSAYQVRNFKSGGEEKSSWTKIGSAWAHGDGKGYNVQLDAFPTDGKIVLRPVKEKKQTEESDEG